jgi:hypothetical protein
MRDKKMFVLKIVWRKSIASLHRLTQDVQLADLRRTAGDPTWVCLLIDESLLNLKRLHFYSVQNKWQKSIQSSSGQIVSKIDVRRMTLRSEYAFYPMFNLMSDCTNISINV